jgi:hypothetical protein
MPSVTSSKSNTNTNVLDENSNYLANEDSQSSMTANFDGVNLGIKTHQFC